MLMPASGPMPGSMPTSVPTRQPRNAYSSTSGRNATEKPSIRLSRVASTLEESNGAGWERRFEQRAEQVIGEQRGADAEGERTQQRLALDRGGQAEQQQRHREYETERGVERGRQCSRDDHAERVPHVAPIGLRQRRARAATHDQREPEHDHHP